MVLLHKRRQRDCWHSWFAWHPVETVDRKIVWLETVERRWNNQARLVLIYPGDPGSYEGAWEYRRDPSTEIPEFASDGIVGGNSQAVR